MANKKTGDIEIGGRLFNTATGNIVAGADAIKDEAQGKTQAEINVETYEHVADINAALQELSPDQTEALALATDVNDLKNNVVRSDEQTLTDAQKAQALANVGISGIDDEPTAGSEKLVKSGGVASTYGSYVENPEFVYVKTDSEGKILWAIKTDGNIYYGAGVPQQVIDYIEEKLADFSPDEYDDIVAFLNNLEKDDKTLQDLLNEKVDKVEGKSLIDSEFAGGINYIENPEFVKVETDSEGKILHSVEKDGTYWFNKLESPTLDNLQKEVNDAIEESQESLIEHYDYYNVSKHHTIRDVFNVYTANTGWQQVKYDSTAAMYDELDVYQIGEICNYDGDTEHSYEVIISHRGVAPAIVTQKYETRRKFTLDEAVSLLPAEVLSAFAAGQKICFVDTDDIVEEWEIQENGLWVRLNPYTIKDPEDRIEIKLDAEDKIIAYRKADGTWVECVGIEAPNLNLEDYQPTEEGKGLIDEDVADSLSCIEDPEGRHEITTDNDDKIISYRKEDGTRVENVGIETPSLKVIKSLELVGDAEKHIMSDIKASLNMPYTIKKFNLPDYGSIDIICELFYLGTDNKEYNPTKVTKVNDTWYVTKTLTEVIDPETGEKSYEVNENSIATTYTEIDVDMEDTTRWPVDKTKHYCKVEMKFGDIDGIWYATVAFQGASTLTLPKKGLRITTYKKSDFAKKDKIKIGEMIATSKFNVKAYYGDPTRLRDVVLQRLVIEARNLRDYSEQYPWNNDYPIFTGAVGTIQSFPVKLTTSGNFYGVSMMGLAKDEHNFMLDGDETGMLISGDYVGPQYPLSFAEFHPETWTDEMNDVEEGEHTPSNFTALTAFWDWVNNGEWNKTTVPQHMSVIDWIDYYIFVQVFRMRDNDIHNIILYTKADKVKFYAFLYDLDLSFGRGYNYDMPIDSERLILWKKFVTLYWDEIVERYKNLRSTILNYNHVSNIITSIQASIPYSDFESEMEKWNGVGYTNATKSMLGNFKSCLSHFDNFFINQ